MTTQSSTWHSEPSIPPSANERAVPGTTVGGRYQLRVAIGHGGMGTVWQAADTVLHRDVAVKEVLLPPGLAVADRTALYERTMREARAAAALSHPSVVQVYDVVTEGGRPWIIMELLHARSLADLIIGDGPLAPRAVAKIGVALLGALEVAHGAGVLHRDVKPANVLICTDGRCVLTDFGVARLPSESTLTTPGMVLGSPHFISPERAVGGAFGPPSDLFSLGVSLYTAIEGRPPFDRGDPFETMRAVVEDPPAKPVRAGALGPVLYGLLEKDPGRRWDVATARQALRDLLNGPLANQAVQHVTDPYTVVPVPHQPPLAAPLPTGQVGGRAMLPPFPQAPEAAAAPARAEPMLEPTSHGLAPVPQHAGSHGLLA
ncbi:MAG: eukaryotic-like serine/threonine-protein kinase, partial [Micromonosporaceae bacterium]